MDRHLVRNAGELVREPLHALDEERHVCKARPLCPPRATHESVGACVDGYRESFWLGPRSVEDVAAVTRTDVHDDMAERGG